MKKLIPGVCLILATGVFAKESDGSGIDAYRQGHYWQAAAALARDAGHDPVALYYLGRMKLYGYAELKNNTQASQYIQSAASKGYVPAMLFMGRMSLNLDKNPSAALTWFKKAAEAHDLFAELYCIGAYKFGFGTAKNMDLVERYSISAAKAGNVLAQYALAEVFLNSKNIQNRRVGHAWLEKAADKEYPPALFRLGQLYANGDLVKKDLDRADGLYDAALKKGYSKAWRGKGDIARSSGDYIGAKEAYLKALQLGDQAAQLSLALLNLDKKSPDFNQQAGMASLLKAANDNVPGAALALANIYANGKAEEKSQSKAWMKRAQDLEKAGAKNPEKELAQWLTNNKETTLAQSGYGLHGILTTWQNKVTLNNNTYNQFPQMENTTKSAIYNPKFELVLPNEVPLLEFYTYYMQSIRENQGAFDFPRYALVMPEVNDHLIAKAILGDSTAQFALGQLYQQGVSVPKNINEAIKYYGKSAAQFDLRAEYNLGLLYLAGETGKPDYQQALGWLTDAAFKGSADAQYVLGQLLSRGYHDASGAQVIEPDLEQATAMYYLGAANRYPRAQFRLAALLSREPIQNMTVAEREQRFKLLQSLYSHASENGVAEARIPLAFFQAVSSDEKLKQRAFEVASSDADDNTLAAFLLGLLYDRGIGTSVSNGKAIKYYERAEQVPVTSFILGTYAAVENDLDKSRSLLLQAEGANFSYAPLNLAILNKKQNQDFMPKLLKARELGNHKASILLADYYLAQNANEEQLADVRVIYQQVAEKGDKEGQLKLAYMYENGLGGPVDLAAAEKWYGQAAQNNQPIAQYRLGRIYQLGRLTNKPNYTLAKYWYAKAANHYVPAAIALGFVYDTVNDNYSNALRAYEVAAKQGDMIAQFNAGLIYENGKGIPVDYEKAKSLYMSAAQQGHIQAMVQLAGLYYTGAVGSRDEKEALKWYQKAADAGEREALYHLGLFAETGIGASVDYSAAKKYYQASASKGDEQAMLALARLYQYGQGVNKNYQEAEVLYKELANNGNAYAAYQLALMSHEGVLGEQSKAQEQQWLQLAVRNGSKEAEQMLLWQKAQLDDNSSFIEPVGWGISSTVANDEPAHWRFLGALDAWNKGNEESSRYMLNQLLKDYPNYIPAKEAYQHIQSAAAWDLSAEHSG